MGSGEQTSKTQKTTNKNKNKTEIIHHKNRKEQTPKTKTEPNKTGTKSTQKAKHRKTTKLNHKNTKWEPKQE